MLKIKDLFFAKVLFFLSFITLSSALFIEHVLGHPPCSLCVFQRIPYIVCFLICGIFLIFKNFDKFFLYSILIIFLIAFILSFYHVGLEQGFFKGSFLCSTSTQEFENPSELLKELKPLQISCKNITLRLLVFSLATLNLILSLAIMIITINRLVNYEKYK